MKKQTRSRETGCGNPVGTQIEEGDKLICGEEKKGIQVFCPKCSKKFWRQRR